MGTLEKLCPTGLFQFVSGELAGRMALEEGKTVYRCEKCGKLHIASGIQVD